MVRPAETENIQLRQRCLLHACNHGQSPAVHPAGHCSPFEAAGDWKSTSNPVHGLYHSPARMV